MMGDRRVGLFWDFENFELRCRSASRQLDVDRVMDFVRPRGRIVVNRAYADWTKHRTHNPAIARLAVETIQVAPVAREKNASDIKLVVDVMLQIVPEPAFEELVLVTSDADFTPLIAACRQRGIDSVVAIGTATAASVMWRESVTEFVEYLDLPPSERFRKTAADPPKTKVGDQARKLKDSKVGQAMVNKVGQARAGPSSQRAIPGVVRDLAVRAITQTPKASEGAFIPIGPLKTRMIGLEPTFDAKDYGCRTFKAFLERLGDVIELSQKGMHATVRLATASGVAPVAMRGEAVTPAATVDPYVAAVGASGVRPPAPGQFGALLEVLGSQEPNSPTSASAVEASLEPIASTGGLSAKGLKHFLTNAHVLYATPDGLCQRTSDRHALAACMVDAVLKTLVKWVPGRLDALAVGRIFGGEVAPPEFQELLAQLARGAGPALPANDAALDRVSLGGVAGGPEHRARVALTESWASIEPDALVDAIARLTGASDRLPDREAFLPYLKTTLLGGWALEPEELSALRGLLLRSGVVVFDDDGGRLAPDIHSTNDAWMRVGRLLARTAAALRPCPHPYVLAGVALPARHETERWAMMDGAATELATSGVDLEPSAKDLAEHEVHGRLLGGPAGLIAKTLWAGRFRVDPDHVDVMFTSLAEMASQPWATKDALKDHLVELFAGASLSSDGPTVNRAYTVLVKVGVVDAGLPVRIRPIDATTAWDRLVPRAINYVRVVRGFVPWPSDLLLVLGGDRPSKELRAAVLRWIGVAETGLIAGNDLAASDLGVGDDPNPGSGFDYEPEPDRRPVS